MARLCIIYNFAQHYRTSIFKLLDDAFDCDFVFGDTMADIKKMDYSVLKGKVTEVRRRHFGRLTWQTGVLPLLRSDYKQYILLGDTHSISTWVFCFIARLFYPNKRVFLWSHGWYGKETSREKFFKKIFFRLPNGGLFLYGNYAKELMIKEGFSKDKLYVIHNSLAYDAQLAIRKNLSVSPIYRSHFNNDRPNLIFIGRLTPVKKLDMILIALRYLKDIGKVYNMTFIGGGERKEMLESLTNELQLQDSVWFYGPCYDEKVLGDLIYNADLCVSPGNVGLTAIHSLVFGTPVVTHDLFPFQMPEFEAIIEGKTGSFFKYGNINSLAEKIDQWIIHKNGDREVVRKECMKEVDENWTPYFQLDVIRQVIE